jgi:hypothetical protein
MFYNEKWGETKELIIGLYPKWKPTEDQARLFREKFSPLDQAAVQEAVKRMWLEDKFGSGQLSPGKLKAKYGIIKDEMAAVFDSKSREDSYGQDRDLEDADIQEQEDACLTRLLMLPFDQVKKAAAKILAGLGRWSMFARIRVDSDNPSDWSFMGKCAVLYEIDNPSEEDGKDAESERHGGDVDPQIATENIVGKTRKPDSIGLLDAL